MRVLIIGAGIAGSTLAILLAKAGMQCHLFERAPAPGGGAALAVASNGLAVLDAAGVLDRVDQANIRTGDWAFENQNGGVLARISDARRGTRFQTRMISRPILQQALEDRLRELGIPTQFGKKLVHIVDEPGKPIVASFADGTSAEGDCLLGADGIGSQVRRCIFPDAPRPAYTGFMAPVGFSPCPPGGNKVTPGSEQPVHLVFGRTSFFEYVDILTPEGPRTVWWSTAETPLPPRQDFDALTTDDLRARLLTLHHGWGDPIPALIRTAERIVPLAIHDFPTPPRWSAGRTLILGDAAHAIGPHSGQASSMALEDAHLLSKLMPSATSASLQEIFLAFETQRRARLDRVMQLGKRAEGRKQEMTPFQYWWLQQQMRIRVPIGSRKSKRWLLDFRIPS